MQDQLAYKLCTPITIGAIRCQTHRPSLVTKVCSDYGCERKALLCNKCAIEDISIHGEHTSKIVDLDNFVSIIL